jgi:Rrf2 family protein
MKRDSRYSVVLHVLMHMCERPEEPMTSEQLADCAGTNPVVIRRNFAGLRAAGILSSSKGHGGGWLLGRSAGKITLGDIQRALDEQPLTLAMAEESPGCLLEQAVNARLNDAVAEAQRLLVQRLDKITLAMVAADVGTLMKAGRKRGLGHV